MVALPKKWVKQMGLRQGSEILITRQGLNSLLITADASTPTNERQEANIELTERDTLDSIFRRIVSLYILGYSQISLRGNNGFLSTTKREGIKELVRKNLIGTEGVSDSKERLTVHVLLGYAELSVDEALRKMMVICTSMQNDAASTLENHDDELAKAVERRGDEVGRFELYVVRQLNMSGLQGMAREFVLEPRDLLGYTMVARNMERVAYHAGVIAKAGASMEEPLPKSTLAKLTSLSGEATILVEDALLSLFKRDHAGADAVVERARRLVEEEELLTLDEKDIKNYYGVHLVAESQKRIAEYAKDIAEAVLDLTIERTLKKEKETPAAVWVRQ